MSKTAEKLTVLINFYGQLIDTYIQKRGGANIVQIGANDGRINDPIYEIVMQNKHRTKILLIEPQKEVIPLLAENYRLHPQSTIAITAVGPEQDLILYRLKPEHWEALTRRHLQHSPTYRVPTGFTSHLKEHVLKHIRGNLPTSINAETSIEQMKVTSTNLDNLLKQHQFPPKIDLLHVDCEGMDDEVLYCCNIGKTCPDIINFEYRHLSVQGFAKLTDYLQNLHYLIYPWSDSDAIAVNQSCDFYTAFGVLFSTLRDKNIT